MKLNLLNLTCIILIGVALYAFDVLSNPKGLSNFKGIFVEGKGTFGGRGPWYHINKNMKNRKKHPSLRKNHTKIGKAQQQQQLQYQQQQLHYQQQQQQHQLQQQQHQQQQEQHQQQQEEYKKNIKDL